MAACGGGNEEKKDLETAGNESKSEDKIPLKISHHPYLHALPSIYAEDNGLYDAFDYTIDMYAGGAGAERSYCIRGLGSGDHGNRRGCPWVSGVQYESDRVLLRRYAGTGYLGEGG